MSKNNYSFRWGKKTHFLRQSCLHLLQLDILRYTTLLLLHPWNSFWIVVHWLCLSVKYEIRVQPSKRASVKRARLDITPLIWLDMKLSERWVDNKKGKLAQRCEPNHTLNKWARFEQKKASFAEQPNGRDLLNLHYFLLIFGHISPL